MTARRPLPWKLYFAAGLLALASARAEAAGGGGGASLSDLCGKSGQSPFRGLEPFRPVNGEATGLRTGSRIDDKTELRMRFRECAESRKRVGADQDGSLCDHTYARILRNSLDGPPAFVEAVRGECARLEKLSETCRDQAAFQSCTKDIYRTAGKNISQETEKIRRMKQDLRRLSDRNLETARREAEQSAGSRRAALGLIARAKAGKESGTGLPPNRGQRQISGCLKEVSLPSFCERLAAATEASLFAGALDRSIGDNEKLVTAFYSNAKVNEDHQGKAGTEGADDQKSGLLGGMDFNKAATLAMLGMTGAGLYCSMTGKCTKKEAANSQSDLASADGLGATSPTPTSAFDSSSGSNSGPDVGSGSGTDGSSSGSEGASSQFSPGAVTIGGGGAGDASTETSSDPGAGLVPPGYGALPLGAAASGVAPFKSEATSGRGLASSTAPSGSGSAGGGGGEGGSLASGGPPGAGEPGKLMDAGGSGSSPVVGGGVPGGGFSLGDGHSSTPTDAALKNILNGEDLPSTGTNALLSEGLVGGEGMQGSGESQAQETSDSLFTRVKSTHVRCIKRGCVGIGVGANI